MNKEDIEYIMTIIRPAIYALYGRQKLQMVAYHDAEGDCQNTYIRGWFQVENPDEGINYRLKINKEIVTHLSVGELNV